jgi:hypothetical protein
MSRSLFKVAQVLRSLLVNKPKFQGKASNNFIQGQTMTTNNGDSSILLIGSLILIIGIFRTAQWVWSMFLFLAFFGIEEAPYNLPSPGIISQRFFFGFSSILPILIIGILAFLISYGIFTDKGWAYGWAIIIVFLNFLPLFVYSHLAILPRNIEGLLTFATFSLVIYLLSTPPVRRVFGKQ